MQIKIVSLNIWNGGQLFAEMSNFLQQQQADIMFLQEAYNGSDLEIESRFQTVKLLTQLFPNYDYNFAPMYLDTREKEGPTEDGQLIISKFPLLKPQVIYFDIPYGPYDHDQTTDFSNFPAGVQLATVMVNQQPLRLLNVHGPVNFDGTADTKRRLKMSSTLLKEIKRGERVILAGDFNVQPHTKTIGNIEQKLKSVFKNQLNTTFNTHRKDLLKHPGYATAVVDMMFISPTIKIVHHECPQVDVSDHLPLVATLAV
jgi:endonuclease/exonuclease/phosphatase family metal-dependent hydrolase